MTVEDTAERLYVALIERRIVNGSASAEDMGFLFDASITCAEYFHDRLSEWRAQRKHDRIERSSLSL